MPRSGRLAGEAGADLYSVGGVQGLAHCSGVNVVCSVDRTRDPVETRIV